MSDVDIAVSSHYSSRDLFDRIMKGLVAAGANPAALRAEDLKPVDEFHIGGIVATDALLDQIDVPEGARGLDVGSGLGGTVRHMTRTRGIVAQGIDLTPEFVEVARRLSALVGDTSTFEVGNALALPVSDNTFDLATLLHVGMNVPDKRALFAEAFRVLRPGGIFAVYDVMAKQPAGMAFPVPWASEPAQSHLATPAEYRAAAEGAGFEVTAERDRGTFAIEFFDALAARFAELGAPPFSVALTMGAAAREKTANMVANLRAGHYAPHEMICRKPG